MEIYFHTVLRDIVGGRDVEVPVDAGQTIGDMIEALIVDHPTLRARFYAADGSLSAYIHIFMDGRNVLLLGGLDAPITPGARINIFPPIGGG